MTMLKVPLTENDHIQGPESAMTTLLEYGDFQCPYCAMAHVQVKQLQARFSEDLRFAFRHFPLTQVHENAFIAAMAAESAGVQGRFWEMHDVLFENQDILSAESIRGFAEELDLDMKQFDDELVNKTLTKKIRADFMGGVRSGVNGTPSFYVNDAKLEGSLDPSAIERLIRAA